MTFAETFGLPEGSGKKFNSEERMVCSKLWNIKKHIPEYIEGHSSRPRVRIINNARIGHLVKGLRSALAMYVQDKLQNGQGNQTIMSYVKTYIAEYICHTCIETRKSKANFLSMQGRVNAFFRWAKEQDRTFPKIIMNIDYHKIASVIGHVPSRTYRFKKLGASHSKLWEVLEANPMKADQKQMRALLKIMRQAPDYVDLESVIGMPEEAIMPKLKHLTNILFGEDVSYPHFCKWLRNADTSKKPYETKRVLSEKVNAFERKLKSKREKEPDCPQRPWANKPYIVVASGRGA
jgi:hypothetical protein